MSLDTAISIIESCAGFTDESTPVGEAWSVVVANLVAAQLLDEADRAEAEG